MRTEEAISSTTERFVSDELLNSMEDRSGFFSLRRMLQDELSALFADEEASDEKVARVVARNDTWLRIENEGIVSNLPDRSLLALLNKDGLVQVGLDKVVYRPDRQIHFPADYQIDFDNLPYSSIEDELIYVFPVLTREDIAGNGGARTTECTSPYDRFSASNENDRLRVTSNAGLRVSISIIRDYAYFPINYQYWYRYFGEYKTENRAAFGNFWRQGNRAKNRMAFIMGLAISSQLKGNRASGTGWTSATPVHTINVSWNPFNSDFNYISFYEVNALASIRDFSMPYLTSGVRHEANQSLHTWACCPWDCSDKTWSDIP